VGSWALISFQATFYTRVYELTPDVYAPALATILPIGGIVGGVGGGLLADWLSKIGGRAWLTAGARGLLAPPRALRGGSPGSWSTGFAAGKGAWLAAKVDALAPRRRLGTCACNQPPHRLHRGFSKPHGAACSAHSR
jgi:hypothetical protein